MWTIARSLRNLPGFGGALRLLAVLALLPVAAAAAETDDELAAKATDPTASLMSFQLNDWYTANYHGQDGSSNSAVFRAAIPFELAGTNQIFRVTQLYVTSSPSGATGFADTTIFDLMVFNQQWGRWGVGISGTLPTGQDGLTTDQWTAGPALGFVNSSSKQYNWGLFAQSFFSFAGKGGAPDVGLINLQPIFSYQLGDGRSLSLGNSAFVYDAHNSRWASLNLGLNYGQVVSFAGHKWRPNVEVDYDFKDDYGNLDRIQIVKGWVDKAGKPQEKIHDVVWSDVTTRKPGKDGKVPPVGDTVDVARATWTNTIGATELVGVWKDPAFDPSLRAYYYARVIEIPTPRWTAYDQLRFGVKMSPDVPMKHQERAWTSPIWYSPKS